MNTISVVWLRFDFDMQIMRFKSNCDPVSIQAMTGSKFHVLC